MFPFSICCAEDVGQDFRPVEFRANSRLVIFNGQLNEEGDDAAHFYVFDNGRFNRLKSMPRKRAM